MQKNLHSINAFNEAKQVIPGGVNSPVRAFKSVNGTPLFMAKGKGSYLFDLDGNTYVDFIQSWGPLIFGHCDEDIQRALLASIQEGLSFGCPTLKETQLAKAIIKVYDNIEKIRLVSSGTEAVMSAIRVARAATQKEDILKFDGCYHGHSDSLLVSAGSGMASLGTFGSPGTVQDLTKHTHIAKYNDIDSVKECFKKADIGVVIIEPIAGNMGLVPADEGFLCALREVCDENGALLIFDEVMSGFRAWLNGIEHYSKVRADMYIFGKVIGGGLPLAAFGGSSKIMDQLSPIGKVYQAGTLSGNPIATTAGLYTLFKIQANPQIYNTLFKLAKRLTDGLKDIAKSYDIPMHTCVRGSMFGFFFNEREVKNFEDAKNSDVKLFAKFHKAMLDRGVYFAPSQFEAGFICTTMNENLIDEVLQKAQEAFKEIKYL